MSSNEGLQEVGRSVQRNMEGTVNGAECAVTRTQDPEGDECWAWRVDRRSIRTKKVGVVESITLRGTVRQRGQAERLVKALAHLDFDELLKQHES